MSGKKSYTRLPKRREGISRPSRLPPLDMPATSEPIMCRPATGSVSIAEFTGWLSSPILWWLWSRNRSDQPSGVYSHQTALSLHELTDVNPSRLDMTVPPSFRRGVPVPPILRLHYGTVLTAEQEVLFQVPVTNALRSIRDVWEEESLPKDTIRQAFQQARASGKITQRQVADLLKDPRCASLARALEAA
jgi:hypothetical protein